MAAISPLQLNIIAAFLEKSRDHLDIEYTIRLHWPHPSRSQTAPRTRGGANAGHRSGSLGQRQPYAVAA
jgi:hypothetical protein